MGEVAEMGKLERATVRAVAISIVDCVTNDEGDPSVAAMKTIATNVGVPFETLMLWFAQELVRLSDLEVSRG